jgi:anti-sigma-K factor RskA
MTTRFFTEDSADLIGAYALDAVEAAEREQFERLLESHAELRAELDEYYDTLSMLVAGFEESPPDHVWEAIAAHIAAPDESTNVVPLKPRPKAAWRDRAVVLLGAAAAVLALVLGVRVVQLGDRVAELEAGAPDPVALAAASALESSEATVAVLSGTPGSNIDAVTIVFDQDGIGFVFGDTLPELAAAETYQLWAITGDAVISAGVLGSAPGIAPFQVADGIDGFAITVEQAGGVVSSENDPAAIWTVDA